MQQRIYSAPISPEDLADFLVRYYEPQHDLQAQKFSEGGGIMVQIAHGDVPEDQRHAVTVAIVQSKEDPQDLVITMGQQQWITTHMISYTGMMGLLSIAVTPWALFGLLWPITELIQSTMLPNNIWHTLETFLLEKGGCLKKTEILSHPHK